ncbi:MAG: hypothetical protein ABIO16_15195 [Nocardioides sp.]
MPSIHSVSRRTVARGVAWSVPVVAVSVAAPAFAASITKPTASGSSDSCKCPPTNSYFLSVTYSTPGNDSWTFNVTQILFDTFDEPFTQPVNKTLAGGDGTLRYGILNVDNNNNTPYAVTITFTATNTTTNQVVTVGPVSLGTINFTPCKAATGLCA